MKLGRLFIVGIIFSVFQFLVSLYWINSGKPVTSSLMYAGVSGLLYMFFMWLLYFRKNKQ